MNIVYIIYIFFIAIQCGTLKYRRSVINYLNLEIILNHISHDTHRFSGPQLRENSGKLIQTFFQKLSLPGGDSDRFLENSSIFFSKFQFSGHELGPENVFNISNLRILFLDELNFR